MATASIHNQMILWTDLEGRELFGRWRVERLVRPEGRTAWFAATGLDGRPAMLCITEALNDETELLTRLRAAEQVRSQHVVAVEDAFAAFVDETPVVVAAMEPTEENLGDVLRERSLQPAEAQQVLEALVSGLAAIHGRGCAQGRMEPASVLAMGETIKLRSDCLMPEAAAEAMAGDVRGMARIVTQAVTRRIPAGENDPVLQLLPEPMARAVRRALSGQAKIEEIAALIGVRVSPVSAPVPERSPAMDVRSEARGVRPGPVMVTPGEREKSAEISAAEMPGGETTAKAETAEAGDPGAHAAPVSKPGTASAAKPVMVSTQPVAAVAPSIGQAATDVGSTDIGSANIRNTNIGSATVRESLIFEDDEPLWNKRRSAPWVVGAAVLVLLAAIWAVYGLAHRGTAKTASTAPAAAVAASGSQPAARSAAPAAVPSPAGSSVAVTTPGWRVVVYTYRHEDQAQHKAQTLGQKYAALQPGVFAPRGRAPYLVTLGGVMSREQALALRERAVRMGLPRDTYAQNYR